jgi:Mg-chelatase subunit ChlD
MFKRPCPVPKTASSGTFDINIHPLYANSAAEMPVCIEIKPRILAQTKDYMVSIVILADVSGSMLDGDKMQNMRDGIVRLAELAERFSTLKTELTIIEFNDSARVVHSSESMPSVAELSTICAKLSPSGGTNIGAALQTAMELVAGKTTTHIALFTDGDDTCGLKDMLLSDVPYLSAMRTKTQLWLHCVGICTDFDKE